jgi:uncharacterized membrane protein YkvA (DUF1232 family)
MGWWQEAVLAVGGGLVVVWSALMGALALMCRGRDRVTLREVVRLLPDVIRLLRRLAADQSLPRGVRIRLGLLIGYLVLPIDLVPDVLPVIGYADDAVVVALALRSVVRVAGAEAIETHWPGTPTGLAVLHRLVGLPAPVAGCPERVRGDVAPRGSARPSEHGGPT